jgi:hypothetical protein
MAGAATPFNIAACICIALDVYKRRFAAGDASAILAEAERPVPATAAD